MPSFQTRLKITGLKPGNLPESVMAAAVEALETRHHVESHQLQLAGGVPQLNLRFLVEPAEYSGENQQAREAAAMMRDAVERVALTGSLTLLRRIRGRWTPV
jgi:muconolactone delta-isomerase